MNTFSGCYDSDGAMIHYDESDISALKAADDKDAYLAHYGVKGMKWHKHLKSKLSSFVKDPTGKKRAASNAQGAAAVDRFNKQYKNSYAKADATMGKAYSKAKNNVLLVADKLGSDPLYKKHRDYGAKIAKKAVEKFDTTARYANAVSENREKSTGKKNKSSRWESAAIKDPYGRWQHSKAHTKAMAAEKEKEKKNRHRKGRTTRGYTE